MKTLLTHNSIEALYIARIAGITEPNISSFKLVINTEAAYVIYSCYPNDDGKRVGFKLKHFQDPKLAADTFTKLFNLPTPLKHIELLADLGYAVVLKYETYVYAEDLSLEVPKLVLKEAEND